MMKNSPRSSSSDTQRRISKTHESNDVRRFNVLKIIETHFATNAPSISAATSALEPTVTASPLVHDRLTYIIHI